MATIQISISAAAKANGPASARVRIAAHRNSAPSPGAWVGGDPTPSS